MSLFRIVKYSSLIYFLGKHRDKLFRSAAVLLFAFVTSLLYDDLRHYLEIQHPGTLLYALIAKIVIVYGSLVFVFWQFRPRRGDTSSSAKAEAGKTGKGRNTEKPQVEEAERPRDRLDELADIDSHPRVRSRYERVLDGESNAKPATKQ